MRRDLFRALVSGDISKLKDALQNLNDVNAQDEEGRTLAFHAIHVRNAEALKTLLEHGIDVEIKDSEGHLPTDQMYYEERAHGFVNLILRKPFESLQASLLDPPRSILFINKEKLFNAAIEGSVVNLQMAMNSAGVWDVNQRLQDGTTALHLAAKFSHARVMRLLLAQHSKNIHHNPTVDLPSFVNARDQSGHTALQYAIAAGCKVCISLLDGVFEADRKEKTVNWNKILHGLESIEKRITENILNALLDAWTFESSPCNTIFNVVFVVEEVSCYGMYINNTSLPVQTLQRDSMNKPLSCDGRLIQAEIYSDSDVWELNALVDDLFDVDQNPGEGMAHLLERICQRLMLQKDAIGLPLAPTFSMMALGSSANDRKIDITLPIRDYLRKLIRTH